MRTLRRPMFRGGSTGTGITSGLDVPRQGYANQSLVQKIEDQKSIIDVLAPRTSRRDTSFNDFLIDF